ncbi:MAG: ATP-grasp domain-containing protein, partial [Myxococcales bacterium]|nr:ATP-grasp domain-containing protein [Myxococcales bacterium]
MQTPARAVGVLGGGQLGRMLALAGPPLGLRVVGLDPNPQAPMAAVAPMVPATAFDDPQALDALAAQVDVVTWEFENVPVAAAERLARQVPVYPAPRALQIAQDRLPEKRFFRELGVPTAPFAPIGGPADFPAALATTGLPALLKTRRLGYDGKGQRWVHRPDDLPAAFAALGGVPCLLEGAVPFERELSVLAARGRDGGVRTFPLTWNTHRDGILARSVAPAPACPPALQAAADALAAAICHGHGRATHLAIELFQVGDALWVNEIAPRVHN